jgi:type II secretory ATPase GspE/PulE/Tfp pilus assembly ATPase PilB-like protein
MLAAMSVNVQTVEDPILISLGYITRSQIAASYGNSF